MMQLIRYLPIIFDLLKKGNDAKDILTNLGKSSNKLKDLSYLTLTGTNASKILQDLFTDTEKDKEKYPEEIFQSTFGNYLKSIDSKSKKDYKNAVKNIASVGLAAYGLSKLGKKYPVPDIQVEETITTEEPQAPVTPQAPLAQPVTPLQLPAPPEVVRAQPGEIITPPVTPEQRGQIKRFEAAQRLQPEMTMAEAKAPSVSQPSAISPQPPAPQPQVESKPIIFETELFKSRPTPANAIKQVIDQGFSEKSVQKFVDKNFAEYAKQFKIETGKDIKQEIKDLIASKGKFKAPTKPKQLFTSKQDKELQDSGLKPKLKPMRKKQQMGDFMKQVQESARPTESLTAPTDRQAFMNSMLELQNLLRGS
jgi:hypothetical protein